MIEVEVLINNFRDLEKFNQKTIITRNGKEIEVIHALFQKGDRYKVSKARYIELSAKGIVSKISKKEEQSKED